MAKQRKKVVRWYDTVRASCDDLADSDDREALAEAVVAAADYWLEVHDEAAVMIVGRLEQLLTENSGMAFYYNGFHTDALQVRKYLEMLLDGYEAKKYVWFQTDPDAKAEYGKLTATDLRNHVKADDTVQLLNDCIRLVADRQHMLEDIRTGFEARGFDLKKIADMRIAKLEEVWVDGTKETDNV